MLSFELVGGEPAVAAFLSGLTCFTLAESLGGVESLIAHPVSMTSRRHGGIGANAARASAPACCACRSASRILWISLPISPRVSNVRLKCSQHRISGGTCRNRLSRRRQVRGQRAGCDGVRDCSLQRLRLAVRGAANSAAAARRSRLRRRDWQCRGRRCRAPNHEWVRTVRRAPSAPSDAEGSSPMEPASMEASSVRMSPNIFSVTMTSKSRGRCSRCMAAESTSMCSTLTSGNSAGMMRFDGRAPQARGFEHIGLVHRSQLAAPARASLAASRTTRSISITAVAAHIDRFGGGARLLAEVNAAGQFAHHHDVDAAQNVGLDRRGIEQRRDEARRAADWRTGPAPCAAAAGPVRGEPWRSGRTTSGRRRRRAGRRRRAPRARGWPAAAASPVASMAAPPISAGSNSN